jgi:thioredoxin
MKTRILLLFIPTIGLALLAGTSLLKAESGDLQILKFEADWCGPCQQMKPIFKKVSKNLASSASFRSINIDDQPDVAEAYGVSRIPTIVAIKDGKVIARSTGFMNAVKLRSFVKKHD